MDTDEFFVDFRTNISARNLFYLLNTGHVNNPEYIKILRCTLDYHGVKLSDLTRLFSIDRSMLKRIFGRLSGTISEKSKVYTCAKIIRAIEEFELVPGLASLQRVRRDLRALFPSRVGPGQAA